MRFNVGDRVFCPELGVCVVLRVSHFYSLDEAVYVLEDKEGDVYCALDAELEKAGELIQT